LREIFLVFFFLRSLRCFAAIQVPIPICVNLRSSAVRLSSLRVYSRAFAVAIREAPSVICDLSFVMRFAYPNRPHPRYLCPLPPAHWNISLLYLFAIGPRI
jgi:hypothetical protein